MYRSFFIAFSIFVTLSVSVFVFDIFPGDYVKKGITCGAILMLTEGTWAIYAVRLLVKKGQEEDAAHNNDQDGNAVT